MTEWDAGLSLQWCQANSQWGLNLSEVFLEDPWKISANPWNFPPDCGKSALDDRMGCRPFLAMVPSKFTMGPKSFWSTGIVLKFLEVSWKSPGRALEDAWKIPGEITGRALEDPWKIPGRAPEDFWNFSPDCGKIALDDRMGYRPFPCTGARKIHKGV